MRVPPNLSRPLGVALLAVVALLPAGCARGGTVVAHTITAQSSGAARPPSAPATPAVVPASLKFTGTTLDGKPFDAAGLAGRPVILWFWAPWCATCLGQGSSVNELAKQYTGRVSLVGVAGLDQSTSAMKDFVSQAEVGDVPHLNDRAGVLWKRFAIKEQSTFVMINRSGAVMQTGYMDSVTLADWASYLDRH
jgi:thiol-disulfide isomerase/thioredoxin